MRALDKDIENPAAVVAAGPSEGDGYIIGPIPAGDWNSRVAGELAIWTAGAWDYHRPMAGSEAYVADEDCNYMQVNNVAPWLWIDIGASKTPLQWTRYVDGATGNDESGDGSVGAPWATIDRAVQCLPDVSKLALIKVAAGTYAEKLQLNSRMGQTIIAGDWTEVYNQVTITSYTRYGVNTTEKWTEMVVVDVGAELPGPWDDTLLDLWVEFADGTYTTRLKIIDYDEANMRIFLGGIAPAACAGTPGAACAFVSIATIIQSDNKLPSIYLNGSADPVNDGTINDPNTKDNGGVLLHAVILENTLAAPAGQGIEVQKGGRVDFGQVGFSCPTTNKVGLSNWGDIGFIWGPAQVEATALAVMDSRADIYFGTGSIYTTNTAGFYNYGSGRMDLMLLASLDAATVITVANHQFTPTGYQSMKFRDIYVRGEQVLVDEGFFGVLYRATLGKCIRCDNDSGRGAGYRVSLAAAAGGKISFYGAPNATYGRIFCDRKGFFEAVGTIDCGDVTALVAAVPLVTFSKGAEARLKTLIMGATGADACPNDAPLLLVEKGSKCYIEGDGTDAIKAYHGGANNNSTIKVSQNSELVVEDADSAITIETSQNIMAPNGIIHVEDASKLNHNGGVSITSTGINCTGYNISVTGNSTYISKSNHTAVCGLMNYDMYVIDSRLEIDGTVTTQLDGQGIYAVGKNTSVKVGGEIVYQTGTFVMPIHDFAMGARGEFGGDIQVPSADYGALPIHRFADGALVEWKHLIADATSPGINWNIHVNGYGAEIRRGAQLICVQNGEGPDGGAPAGGGNELYLGRKGATAPSLWPAAGATLNDLPAAAVTAGDEELVAVHCR